MKRHLFCTLFLLPLLSSPLLAASAVLPFGVSLNGQKATASDTATFATLSGAVDDSAQIVVDVKTDKNSMIIINIFAADGEGNSKDGAPEVILLRGKNSGKLSDTMSRKRLKPGCYRMSIVAGGKTAILVFQVK